MTDRCTEGQVFESRDGARLSQLVGGVLSMTLGLLMLFLVLGVMETVKVGTVQGTVGMTVLGAVFLVAGLALTGFRTRRVVDRASGTFVKSMSTFFPLRKRVWRLENFDSVSLSEEKNSSMGKASACHVYTLHLTGNPDGRPDSAERVLWSTSTSYAQSRQEAESLARFLELPLRDSSGGALSVRNTDDLEQPLKQRVKSQAVTLPECPGNLRSKVTLEEDRVRIVIPDRKLSFVPVTVVMAISLAVSLALPNPPRNVLLCVSIVGLILGLCNIWRPKRITAAADFLQIGGDRLETIRLKELVFDASNPDAAIVARSDRQVVSFGAHLSVKEKRYLHALISAVVTL